MTSPSEQPLAERLERECAALARLWPRGADDASGSGGLPLGSAAGAADEAELRLARQVEAESRALRQVWQRLEPAGTPDGLTERALAGIRALDGAAAVDPAAEAGRESVVAEADALRRLWPVDDGADVPALTALALARIQQADAAEVESQRLARIWPAVADEDLPAGLASATLARLEAESPRAAGAGRRAGARLVAFPSRLEARGARWSALAGVAAALLLAFGLGRVPVGPRTGDAARELTLELPFDLHDELFHERVGDALAALEIAPEEDWFAGVDWAVAADVGELGRLQDDAERLLASVDEF